jgi:surfeit locus 1 family protein
MAKGQNDTETDTWVPAGLKVRGVTPTSSGPPVSPALTFPVPAKDEAITRVVDTMTPPPTPKPLAHAGPAKQSQKAGFEPMPVLTLVTLICLGILLWLGSWQWEKFVLKSTAVPNVAVQVSSVSVALEASNPEYRLVVVDGLMDTRTIKVAAVQDAVRGYRLFSPVVMEVGGIFVDRGFVSETDLSRVKPSGGQVSLTGVLRVGAKANAYTPDNEVARDVWYWPDLRAMADTLMIQSTGANYYVALSEVDPLGTGKPIKNPYADSKGANQVPAERHWGYALTWWGFGLALMGVYIGMHVRAGRLRFKRTPS